MQSSLYTKEIPESWDSNSLRIKINSSSTNLKIDPVIWVKYTIKFTESLKAFFIGTTPDNADKQAPLDNRHIATRHCWCMARAMDSVSVNINNKSTITHIPRFYIDPLSRLYVQDNVAKNGTSGGAFDTGLNGNATTHDYMSPSILDAVNNTVLLPPLGSLNCSALGNNAQNAIVSKQIIGANSSYVNTGLELRRQKLYETLVRNDSGLDATGGAATIFPDNTTSTLELWEPLPIEPFFMLTKFQRPYNLEFIEKLNVNIRFAYDKFKYIFNTNSPDALPDIEFERPEIWVRYVDTAGLEMPVNIPMHINNVIPFTIDRTSNNVFVEGTNSFTYDIDSSAEKLYFYMRKRDQLAGDATEHFLGIESIKINTPTIQQEISNRQLYAIWLNESVNDNLSFDEWRHNKSVVILRKSELQLDRRITLEVTWRNYWKIPTFMGRDSNSLDDGVVTYQACLLYSHDVEFTK